MSPSPWSDTPSRTCAFGIHKHRIHNGLAQRIVVAIIREQAGSAGDGIKIANSSEEYICAAL